MRNTLTLLIAIFTSLGAMAQGSQAGTSLMESHLKIYVVVAVLAIIFSGIIIFMLAIERRLKRLEEGK